MTNFDTIELAFCISEERYIKVAIDKTVQDSLKDMYDTFYTKYNKIEENALEFELSEKYAGSEKLFSDINKEYVSEFKKLFTVDNILSTEIKLSDIFNNITYYFAIFYNENKKIAIGVKRPNKFKGLLKKSLIAIVDDTLKLVKEKIFSLDFEFDFIIKESQIDILHPAGFINLSEMSDERQIEIATATRSLIDRVNFINFDNIADFVSKNKTAARYIASIKSRNDLELTQKENLCTTCDNLKISYNINKETGIITPEKEHILDFLCILDRREYDINLTGETERYRASSRQLKK